MPQPAVANGMELEQIDRPTQQRLQRFLQIQEILEATSHGGLKLYENVDVALGAEILAEDRAERLQPPNPMAAAHVGNGSTIAVDQRMHTEILAWQSGSA